MHLGRFHAVIHDLSRHFESADLINRLTHATSQLSAYISNHSEQHLVSFREALDQVYSAADVTDQDLLQPYAQQVIEEIGVRDVIGQDFRNALEKLLSTENFDTQGLINRLNERTTEIKNKIAHIRAIDNAFDHLGVEYQRVLENDAEVGFMLPREVVGDSLKDLSNEFSKIGNLAKAINEISGAADYDPKVVTIASSWWQVFLDLDPAQIALWVMAIEKIILIHKSGLEIKKLKNELAKQNVSQEITKKIDEDLEKRMADEVGNIAVEIRAKHSKIADEARGNELEVALRQGLAHLSLRISQGAQVEINVSIPDEPPADQAENQELSQQAVQQIAANRARIQELRQLRSQARIASSSTYKLSTGEVQLLIADGKQAKPSTDPVQT